MSDSDADDSGFDREAERERLREKYENDEEERAETERMSELLLQGATMTNKHCDTCGNPIFRYDGEEFCAVCQQPTDAQDVDDGVEADRDHAASTAAEPRQGADAEATEQVAATDHAEPGRTDRSQRRTERGETTARDAAVHRADEGDLGAARASLVRTLTTLAQRAESSDDVRRTTEYLEAAREAADAIAAIDGRR